MAEDQNPDLASPDSPAAESTQVADTLVDALRKRILGGEFGPGEFLRDVRMASEHNTSRHTFRVAARTMVERGLLEQIPNRGFRVPAFGPDDVVDITRLRGALEGEAVRMIVLTGNIPAAALEAIEIMRQASKTGDRPTLVAADRNFHRAIVAASGSPRLMRNYAMVDAEIELLLVQRQNFYDEADEIVQEHEALITGLRSRHFDTARAAFLNHWKDLQEKLLGGG